MTTIFKMSDQESITPTFEHVERSLIATRDEDSGQKMAAVLDDAGLADEMDKVEKCASTGRNYAYNPDWSTDQIAQLREYAAVVEMKGQMLPAKPVMAAPVVVDDAEMMSLAAASSSARPRASAELSMAVGDPFRLSDTSDAPKGKDNWEKVTYERKLASAPDMGSRTGSILPIRGEFEYEKQQQLRVRRGENSLANPDAIGALAKEQDTGERLKTENANTREERKSAKTAWQKEAVQAAKNLGAGALSRGKVFMTGSIPEQQPQSGLDLKQASEELGKMTAPTLPELPDQTAGERLGEINAARKNDIQRKAVSEDWQKVKGTTRPSLSDAFAEALEAQLGRAGVKMASSDQQVVKTASKTSISTPVKKTATVITSAHEEQSEAFAAALEAQLLKTNIKV